MTGAQLSVVTGDIDTTRTFEFRNLYRLLDVDRAAQFEYQKHTMPAAFEVLAAWESDEWKQDKEAEFQAYIDQHGYQPGWSATSSRSFVKWLQDRAERDGHPVRTRQMLEQLRDVALCVRFAQQGLGGNHGYHLPNTERGWRPALKLLRLGFTDEIADVVVKANEIAEAEDLPLGGGVMLAARQEVWKTAPRIRQWVEQPGQVENRTTQDRLNKLHNDARHFANQLRTKGDDETWQQFLTWVNAL